MAEKLKLYLSASLRAMVERTGALFWRIRNHGPAHLWFWLLALAVGIASGLAAVGFRLGIEALQGAVYGTDDLSHLHTFVRNMAWYWVLAIPALGGLTVGLVLNWFTPDGRVRSVGEVIEAAALRDGKVERRAGLGSAIASFITLSTGGSTGREGPVVHLAAVISAWVATRINASGVTARDLLGCAAAAAVSASFNAPIAGALFALEVVLRHFAVHAFAPIAISAVAGTVIGRLSFGDVTEFRLADDGGVAFYVEMPAFLILGVVCGLVAVVLMRSIIFADGVASTLMARLRLARALRPAVAGLLLGAIANFYPHIIGVGYETTSAALTGELLLHEAVVFAVVKTVAVAITMAGRMGGGVFSPSLMMGALSGLAFGLIATHLLPDVSGSQTLYALAGMGAVAASVLGAPISTTLIVFELTGDWQTGIAVMATVSVSTALSTRLVDRSFFLTQLERRGVHLAAGPHAYLLSTLRVAPVMRERNAPDAPDEAACWELVERELFIDGNATLEQAMEVFEGTDSPFLPVVRLGADGAPMELSGALFEVDALRAFTRALSETAAEEHS